MEAWRRPFPPRFHHIHRTEGTTMPDIPFDDVALRDVVQIAPGMYALWVLVDGDLSAHPYLCSEGGSEDALPSWRDATPDHEFLGRCVFRDGR